MQLITILLSVVSALIVLSGISILAGSTKKERASAIWFLVAAIGATIWAVAVGFFLNAGETDTFADDWVKLIFTGSMLMMIALMGYVGWSKKLGKILTTIFAIGGIALMILVFTKPELFFNSVSLDKNGNIVNFNNGLFLWLYGGFISITTFFTVVFLVQRILQSKKKSLRSGYTIFLVGLSINSVFSLIFDLILPMSGRCDLMWLGPLAIGVTILTFYYSILRFRMIQLSSSWMKILSYVIIVTSGAIAYMIIFYTVFTALFRVSSPSFAVIALNFIMIVIVLLLLPVINELGAFIRSLIYVRQIDLAYIVKKLNHTKPQHVDLLELASFLMDHLHLTSVGFIVNDRLRSTESLSLTTEDLVAIKKLKTPAYGIWQDPNEAVSHICREQNIYAIAELRDDSGVIFGQIILGKPISNVPLARRDFIQIEMVINLTASLIAASRKTHAYHKSKKAK